MSHQTAVGLFFFFCFVSSKTGKSQARTSLMVAAVKLKLCQSVQRKNEETLDI